MNSIGTLLLDASAATTPIRRPSAGEWDLFCLLVARALVPATGSARLRLVLALVGPLCGAGLYRWAVALTGTAGPATLGPIDVLIRLTAWGAFAAGVRAATDSLVAHGPLLRGHAVPPMLFPVASAAAAVIRLGLALAPVGAWALVAGPGAAALPWLAAVLAAHLTVTAALGVVLAHAHTVCRLVGSATGSLLRVGLFATPVLWRPAALGDLARWVVLANPAACLVEAARAALIEGSAAPVAWMGLIVWSPTLVVVAATVEGRAKGTVADRL